MALAIEQSIDYSYIRLPFEVIVKQFKSKRKQLEHDLTITLSEISHINTQGKADQVIEKIRAIQKALQENQEHEKKYLESYLQRLKCEQCGNEIKLQRSLVDNLLREGYFKTAQKLIQSYQIDNLTSFEQEIIIEANTIIQDLKSKSIKFAYKWCSQNSSKYKKFNSAFQNDLVFQQYIEYLKQDVNLALNYIRDYQIHMNEESILKAMGCLIFIKEKSIPSTYQQYFDDKRWDMLIRQFKQELYNIYCYPKESPLLSCIKCGITTLKTQYCDQTNYQQMNRCPICNKQMQELSKDLLTTQKLGSTWICRISGELMDENNPPMMLPNNQVYSQQSLLQMSEQQNGYVYCIVTKQTFKINECVRVFLT
ncbi:unnamed protein product [Paramecium pentaurelia]|uniref:Macrophage erythroblast attacher n=1 Tax=Paramecium pentaurelia TaxID=43138 RepID=A0A8S1S1D3_9CILI|nr:unnamed protein product [Paramecium pentaurelia]